MYIDDHCLSVEFSIAGLQFEPNNIVNLSSERQAFLYKICSSSGPLISDFVTHEQDFTYSTFGIHVGQDDRLTFMGGNGRPIVAECIDCREGSPTLHQHLRFSFMPRPDRKLIIPRGVAHTFDNLEFVVTRDEPVWHSDWNNPDWNVDNDLVSIPRKAPPSQWPVVRPNRFLLPDDVHCLLSRMSQTLLENPTAYLARYKVRVANQDTYVAFEPETWAEDRVALETLLKPSGHDGVTFIKSRYALTGPQSWTLVPSTGACVADVLLLSATASQLAEPVLHTRTRKYLTLMGPQNADVTLETVDCRQGRNPDRKPTLTTLKVDPRRVIVIDPGVSYAFRTSVDILVRSEQDVFVAADEPRSDLRLFNVDSLRLSEFTDANGLNTPEFRCPDALVYRFGKEDVARFENAYSS